MQRVARTLIRRAAGEPKPPPIAEVPTGNSFVNPKTLKVQSYVLGAGLVAGGCYTLYAGYQWSREHSEDGSAGVLGAITGARSAVNEWVSGYTEPSESAFLPDPYPREWGGRPRTLVIAVEGVLVHNDFDPALGFRTKLRPGAEKFLQSASLDWEIVLWSEHPLMAVQPIMEALSKGGNVLHRLYRDATRFEGGVHLKDVGAINRPLDTVVVIDSHLESLGAHPDNALLIDKWTGDREDTQLLDLLPALRDLAETGQDVRPVIRSCKPGDQEPTKTSPVTVSEFLSKQG